MTNFEQVYRQHFSVVYKYALSLCRNEVIAEEITQETFFKALKSIHNFKGECKPSVWLCQIAKNTYFSYLSKSGKCVDPPDNEQLDPSKSVEAILVDEEQAKELHCLIHGLPEPYKEVLTLRIFGELSFAEIGELFSKSDSWARLVFYRAKKKLLEAST